MNKKTLTKIKNVTEQMRNVYSTLDTLAQDSDIPKDYSERLESIQTLLLELLVTRMNPVEHDAIHDYIKG